MKSHQRRGEKRYNVGYGTIIAVLFVVVEERKKDKKTK